MLFYVSEWDIIILVLFDVQEWAYIPTHQSQSNEIPIIYGGSSQFKFKSHPSRYCLHLYSLYDRNMTAEQILLMTSRNLGIPVWKQNAAIAYHDVYKHCFYTPKQRWPILLLDSPLSKGNRLIRYLNSKEVHILVLRDVTS